MTDRQPVLNLQVTVNGDDPDHTHLKALTAHLKRQIKTFEFLSKDRDFSVTYHMHITDLDDQTFPD